MKLEPDFPSLCESFFTKWLIAQRKASPHTVAAYAHTFRLLAGFAQERLNSPPSKLALAQQCYFTHTHQLCDRGTQSREASTKSLMASMSDCSTSLGASSNDCFSPCDRLLSIITDANHSGMIARDRCIPNARLKDRIALVKHGAYCAETA